VQAGIPVDFGNPGRGTPETGEATKQRLGEGDDAGRRQLWDDVRDLGIAEEVSDEHIRSGAWGVARELVLEARAQGA
jgi:hypothetical protein